MFKTIIQSIRATLVLALITGILFPLFITALAQVVAPNRANGSLLKDANGTIVGSALLAQQFTKPIYFHPRPSAAGNGYAGEASSGSNLGPTSKKLFEGQPDDPKTTNVDESFQGVKQLAENYRNENGLAHDTLVPVDAVTRSGSGLDPEISVENAKLQAGRVAKARSLPLEKVIDAVNRHTAQRQFGILGEPGVNVLLVNMYLDQKRD
ncbi:MAG TPA: K(+)-transporting ATPase subunit C [Oculatellaceae cyanobacterium]